MMAAGRVNAWKCPDCGLHTVTIHRHSGTTPMLLGCRAMAGCNGVAVSIGYPKGDPPDWLMAELKWEWYQPTRAEMDELEPALLDHVIRGGLLLREIVGKPPKVRVGREPDSDV